MIYITNNCSLAVVLITLLLVVDGAKKYIRVPELLQNQFNSNILIEYHYDTVPDFEIKEESIGKSAIYTCRIGGYGSREFFDCFPFPPSTAIPKSENKKMLETECKKFAKRHVAYWVEERLVWCDVEQPKEEMVRYIDVPVEYRDEYGTRIIYNDNCRTKPTYQMVTYTKDRNRGKSEQKQIFICKVGVLNTSTGEITECFAYPAQRTIIINAGNENKQKAQKNCVDIVNEHFVYWYGGRMVWCDAKQNEYPIIVYRRGAYVVNVQLIEQKYFGDKVYYDLAMPAEHKIHHVFEKKTRNIKFYECKIGGFNIHRVFIPCFPEPKRLNLPKNENEQMVETECSILAKKYVTYWDRAGNRIVWCAEKQMEDDSTTKASTSFSYSLVGHKGMVKVIKVPLTHYSTYGKILVYQERFKADYLLELRNDLKEANDRTYTKYLCRVGIFDSQKNLIDCFPYPDVRRLPKYDISISFPNGRKKCNRYASKFFVYRFDGRLVWCDEEEKESEWIPYRKGTSVLRIPPEYFKKHGDKIYYDYITAATHRVKYISEKHKFGCEVGGYDTNKEFQVCFPEPSQLALPRTGDRSQMDEKCKNVAVFCTLYWHDTRLVWCQYDSESEFIPIKKYRSS